MSFPFSEDVTLPDGPGPSHVPSDLDDAHRELDKLLLPADLARLRAGTEDEMGLLHRELGAWMRHHWGFFRGSRLADHLRGLGLSHPDDMSGLVLTTFWRSLHGQPLRVQEEVDHYQEHWRSVRDPVGGTPLDGASIRWTFQQRLDRGKRRGGRVLHLGISESDGRQWRYEYGGAAKIEPATSEDLERLREIDQMLG